MRVRVRVRVRVRRPEHLLDGGVQPKRESLEAAVARVLGRGHLGRFRFGIKNV